MQHKHTLKLRKQYIEAVLAKEKTFEVRKNDRGFQKGDLVKFIPVIQKNDSADVPIVDLELEKRTYEITYVHSGLGLQEGYVVFGIKERYDLMEEGNR